MRTVRLVSVCVLLVTLLAGSALAKSGSPGRPSSLKAFLLRAGEPAAHEFPRTPSFSWRPVRGAIRYEFQLSKSPGFGDASIFWRATGVRGPAVAVPLQLPWMTGSPYAAYARVRAVTSSGVGAWSKPFGFNIRWKQLPRMLPGVPGLSRWTPVEGATSYEVWFTRIGPGAGWTKKVATRTTAVDHREAYTFHDDATWTSEVRWRVRAVRVVPPKSRVHVNGLPAVSYGPWSKEFVSHNPPVATGALTARMALTADATSRLTTARSHELTPAFSYSGREAYNVGPAGSYGLYRVYVFSDSDCVNVVFKGAITGAPAYAPRTTGGLLLPQATGKDLDDAFVSVLKNGSEGSTFMADLTPVKSTEEASVEAKPAEEAPPEGQDPAVDKPGEDPTITGADPTGATVDLPESGWPNGRYYWTVVPVSLFIVDESKIEYHDVRQAQDTCNQGSEVAFGKQSMPAVGGQGSPFASGLSPKGRLVAARGGQTTFYGRPLVAWLPVQGAVEYEVQWSRQKYPWRAAGAVTTAGTASELGLKPGHWWYRIRGINPFLPGQIKAMAWSQPLRISVAKPRFAIAR
jgi:hypothetical protein